MLMVMGKVLYVIAENGFGRKEVKREGGKLPKVALGRNR
jgi:hypothetical protein